MIDAPIGPTLTTGQKREMLYQDDYDEDNEAEEEIIDSVEWTSKATFDEIMVWGHEGVVDGQQDEIMKGIEEWIGIAPAVST